MTAVPLRARATVVAAIVVTLLAWASAFVVIRAVADDFDPGALTLGRLAVAAPWLVLLLLCFQPDVIQRYATPAGVAVLATGGVLCAAAYRLMVRIGRLPVERRILS